MKEAAVIGCLTGYKTRVDGSLVITVMLDEIQAQEFHQSFQGINLTVAVARLTNDEPSQGSSRP
jgi:hypothetical protein